jgi:hypothetical protein
VQILSYAIIQEKDTGFPYFYLPGPGVFIRARRGSCTRNLQYNRELISFLPAALIIITADFSPAGEGSPGGIFGVRVPFPENGRGDVWIFILMNWTRKNRWSFPRTGKAWKGPWPG